MRWDQKYWTPERAQRAMELSKSGCSASEIAAVLGNVTRNAVIGKLQRLKCRGGKTRALEAGKRQFLQRRRANKPSKPKRIIEMPKIPVVLSTYANDRSFNDVSGPSYGLASLDWRGCKWPISFPDKDDFCFCAAPRENFGVPYCEAHQTLARHPSNR